MENRHPPGICGVEWALCTIDELLTIVIFSWKAISLGSSAFRCFEFHFLKSGLQPHTGSAKVPWVLDWQLYAWKLSELHPTSRWLSFKKDTGWWPHSMQGDVGWSVSSSTAWEYFRLALHKVCALGVRDEAESIQTPSSDTLWLGSLSFCPCLSQLIPSAAAPHWSPSLWWQLRQWGPVAWYILNSCCPV